MTERTCSTDGCTKRAKARGLCSTHYNRLDPNRHRKQALACAYCGAQIVKLPRSSAKRGVVCSVYCRRGLQTLITRGEEASSSTEIVARERQQPKQRVDTRKRPRRRPHKFFAGRCRVCGDSFVSVHTHRTCSGACFDLWQRLDRQERRHRRRALIRNAYVAPVNARAIYARDSWRCQLCGEPVDRDGDPQGDFWPSIDHIIPLANGGSHEPANCWTAHRLCNALRSNRPFVTAADGAKVSVLF